jgi:hypothetical protein
MVLNRTLHYYFKENWNRDANLRLPLSGTKRGNRSFESHYIRSNFAKCYVLFMRVGILKY